MLNPTQIQSSKKSLEESKLQKMPDEKTYAKRFIDNIDQMRNPHIRDCVDSSEKSGTIEDYSKYQEQSDLARYRRFISSSAYDEIKEVETKMPKKLTFSNLR